MNTTTKTTARKMAPQLLVRILSGARNYFRRLSAWAEVIGCVRGATPVDNMRLWLSALVSPVSSLSQLSTWREPQLLFETDVVARDIGVFGIRAHSDDLGHLLPSGIGGLLRAMAARLKPGDTVLDAGANIGAVTIFLAKHVGPTGRVIAVEMMPDTARRLRRHIALNGLTNVEVVENALAARAGLSVTASVPEGFFGQASIASELQGKGRKVAQVQTTTIDHVTQSLPFVHLIKLDLEGAEEEALDGATQTLAKTNAIVFESWTGERGLSEILVNKGFSVSPVDARNFLALAHAALAFC